MGGALIVPGHLIGEKTTDSNNRVRNTEESEAIGMEAVMAAERAQGRNPVDVSMHNRGWDIESFTAAGEMLLIEVKARVRGSEAVYITRNEILQAKNAGPRYHLAVVLHENGYADQPLYVSNPGPGFGDPGEFGDTHHAYPLRKLLERASTQPKIVAITSS